MDTKIIIGIIAALIIIGGAAAYMTLQPSQTTLNANTTNGTVNSTNDTSNQDDQTTTDKTKTTNTTKKANAQRTLCHACQGSGKNGCIGCEFDGKFDNGTACPDCKGKGYYVCTWCGGDGYYDSAKGDKVYTHGSQ